MLRKIDESDLGQLLLIEEEAHIAPWSAETFDQCFKAGYRGWGIELERQIIGFIIVSMNSKECHILNLCVHPDHQHHGFGEQLMNYFLEIAKESNINMVLLEVRCSNLPAIHLYNKLGFIKIGERKNYYPTEFGREDALVLAKDLGVE